MQISYCKKMIALNRNKYLPWSKQNKSEINHYEEKKIHY